MLKAILRVNQQIESRVSERPRNVRSAGVISVIAEHGVNADAGLQIPEQFGARFDVSLSAVGEVPGQRNQVRLQPVDDLDAAVDVIQPGVTPVMNIAQLRDSQP